MAASFERTRRSRYIPERKAATPLTPRRLTYLTALADNRVMSLPQLACLFAEARKTTARQMRGLLDQGLVTVIPLPRAVLTATATNDQTLLGGSSPNLYRLTSKGAKQLRKAGLRESIAAPPRYGPRNSLFLAHHLAVVDIWVWLMRCASGSPDERIERWETGASAAIDLKRPQAPKTVRPDAWFVYRLSTAVLVGLVEVDRGTEGPKRWVEKIAAYSALFASSRLKETTGYINARILITTPTASRRDYLAALLAKQAPADLARRCWLAEVSVLQEPTFTRALWRQPGSPALHPLLTRPAEASHDPR